MQNVKCQSNFFRKASATADKKQLRKLYGSQRLALSFEAAQHASTVITARLRRILSKTSYNILACYLPIKREVDVFPLIGELLHEGKVVSVPHEKDLSNEYYFVKYSSHDFESNIQYGHERGVAIAPAAIDIIVCPGFAFDRQGYRLGYGYGIYDRLLIQMPNTLKIGICYDFQLVDELPREQHDLPMDIIVTEMQMIDGL